LTGKSLNRVRLILSRRGGCVRAGYGSASEQRRFVIEEEDDSILFFSVQMWIVAIGFTELQRIGEHPIDETK
jgi:hypothetical protein